MEFLMTYGWAILAAIIVIGVIAIYFRPGNLVGQASIFSPPFTAVSQAITASNEIARIELRNSGAESLSLAAAPTATINNPSGGTCTPVLSATQGGATVAYPYTWNSGVTLFLDCTSSADLVAGKTFDADITVTYTSGAGTLAKVSTGTISGKINA